VTLKAVLAITQGHRKLYHSTSY